MEVILYSTHCPKCDILEKKLNGKNIDYKEINDINVMLSKGFEIVPMLEVNGTIMSFKEASEWVNKQGESNEYTH